MALERYDDRVFCPIWNATNKKIEEKDFYDERCYGGLSHITQLKKVVSYWCEQCECAFRRSDVQETALLRDPNCPICGTQLVPFDLDNIAPEWEMDIAQDEEGNWVPKDDLPSWDG